VTPSPRPRITVVNDNPDFLELMSAILDEDAGYEVAVYDGETTTLDAIAGSEPDLLIIDLLLGGVSGWELVVLARADQRLSDVPVIVCSADVAELRERTAELERIGDIHVLEKPFSIEEVTDLVASLVHRTAAPTG
jgi:DNA-binding response OmpR family regulator